MAIMKSSNKRLHLTAAKKNAAPGEAERYVKK
jgi:hypothetical protein